MWLPPATETCLSRARNSLTALRCSTWLCLLHACLAHWEMIVQLPVVLRGTWSYSVSTLVMLDVLQCLELACCSHPLPLHAATPCNEAYSLKQCSWFRQSRVCGAIFRHSQLASVSHLPLQGNVGQSLVMTVMVKPGSHHLVIVRGTVSTSSTALTRSSGENSPANSWPSGREESSNTTTPGLEQFTPGSKELGHIDKIICNIQG